MANWPRDVPAGAVPGPDAAVNRAAWTAVNAEYAAGHAESAWRAGDFGWGIFGIAEQELGVLGEVAGLDVVELGCGTAYLSAWLARQGARPVGVDVTHAQLVTARRCQEQSGTWFPLIEADAARVAARRRCLRAGGVRMRRQPVLRAGPVGRRGRAAAALGRRLVFHTVSVLAVICQPADGPAGLELQRPQRQVRRVHGGRGIEYHPDHSEWISVLTTAGLVVDALHELYAPPGGADHPYYQVATADWARQWPVEDIWIAHRPAT